MSAINEITMVGRHLVGVDADGRLRKLIQGRWAVMAAKQQRDRRPYFRARYAARKAAPSIVPESEREAAHV